jgi:autotransporter strand-loop-strand O-heptosyltransferase
MTKFLVDYVTRLPKDGDAPRVTITGDVKEKYKIYFYNGDYVLLSIGECETNQTYVSNIRQWYCEWNIIIIDYNDTIVHIDKFDLRDKFVSIKIDSYAMGDNIAWIPYVEEFRKKHNCFVICSTFFNHLFIDAYPNIIFVNPNTMINNIYAQYYIGASNNEFKYSPINVESSNLQSVASSILGLKHREIKPDLTNGIKKISVPRPYVTLSEFGSSEIKGWKYDDGWQIVVNFLVDNGFDVVVISKEPTKLKNIINLTGNIDLENRMVDIVNASFHIGVSSGLSWLAWALGKFVIMISDGTPSFHEFNSNAKRFCANDINMIDFDAKGVTNVNDVIACISDYLEI